MSWERTSVSGGRRIPLRGLDLKTAWQLQDGMTVACGYSRHRWLSAERAVNLHSGQEQIIL